MKQKHLDKLYEIIESSLNAHKMAQWNNEKARSTITKLMIKKFKRYLDLYEEKQ